jgi:hypothetical protein
MTSSTGSSDTKTIKLLGREVTLYRRDCHVCDESCWFQADVFVCDGCSEINLQQPAPRAGVVMSELRYQGDYNSQR